MKPLVTVDMAARALGLDPQTPLTGYVARGETLRESPALIEGLAADSRDAKALMASDDAAWDRLGERMKAANDAEFEALKAGFKEGIPEPGPVDEAAADRMLELMAEIGGSDVVGPVTDPPDGLFVQPGS